MKRLMCKGLPLLSIAASLVLLPWPAVCSQAPQTPYETISRDLILIEYAPSRKRTATEIAEIASSSVERLASELGMRNPRGVIRIRLPEAGDEPWSRGSMPLWVAGFAVADAGTVVLVAGREPRYPDRSIRALLDHELAHILVHRALVGKPVPRWFSEGTAMILSREWVFLDSWHTTVGMVLRRDRSLQEISGMFHSGHGDASTAYALSYSFTRFLVERHGPDVLRQIIHQVASGKDFSDAFRASTGSSLYQAEQEWRKKAEMRYRWIPMVTSSTTLWLLMTVLTLLVFLKKRRRTRRLLKDWGEEEERTVRARVIRPTGEDPRRKPDDGTDGWVM